MATVTTRGENGELFARVGGVQLTYMFKALADMSRLSVSGRVSASNKALTLSPPILLRLYTLPYCSNAPFLISDIRALWRSVLSARAPECQKLKMVR